MQPILEYLKRREKQSYYTDDFMVHYKNGLPDGVVVNVGDEPFVLSAREIIKQNWDSSVGIANKFGGRLPSREEYYIIFKYHREINELMKQIDGVPIGENDYWNRWTCETRQKDKAIEVDSSIQRGVDNYFVTSKKAELHSRIILI